MPTTTNGMTSPGSAAPDAGGKVTHPLVARRLAVADVADLGAGLRRITLDGPDVAGLVSLGVTDHVKLFVPARPGADVVHPRVVDGAWLDKRDPALTYREMTVRTHVEGGPLVLEIVAGDHGPASRWAAQAQVGQEVGVLGPKSSALRPLDRPRYVLAVDATGLPAVRNWLDRLPASAHVTVLVGVGSATGADLPLPARAGLDVVQLAPTDDGALATAVERLLATPPVAAADVTPTDAGVPTPSVESADVTPSVERLLPTPSAAAADGGTTGTGTFWWAAAEAAQIRRIRAALVAAGVPRDSWAMTAYWRRGVAHFDHKSPDA